MIIMNRNTSPISPFSEKDYLTTFKDTEENQYPEQEIIRFKELYAAESGWEIQNIELANGSDEWLQKLMIIFAKDGVLSLAPDFVMYEEYVTQMGYQIETVSAEADFTFSLDKILAKIEQVKPKLFILSNPQNPTGVLFSQDFLDAISDAMQAINGYFAIDEAYVEFASEPYRPVGEHVILLRTMSKIYGMAGLRIGMLHATGATYDLLTQINHPYPVNSLALNLANAFLADSNRVKAFKEYQLQSRQALIESFEPVKALVNLKPTQSNFIFTYGPAAKHLGEFLLAKDFLPRTYPQPELSEVVRYSIIKLEDYAKLQLALKEWSETHDFE